MQLYYVYLDTHIVFKGNYYQCLEYIQWVEGENTMIIRARKQTVLRAV
jgi:hypothetical protein